MEFKPWDNPMGTDGFEFVEYAAPDPKGLGALFETMGFTAIAHHRTKDVTLYRQGEINFIINAEPDSFAQRFARQHGQSVCAIAIRVNDAAHAYKRALELGAWGFDNKTGPMELNIPAIKGVGDALPRRVAGFSRYRPQAFEQLIRRAAYMQNNRQVVLAGQPELRQIKLLLALPQGA